MGTGALPSRQYATLEEGVKPLLIQSQNLCREIRELQKEPGTRLVEKQKSRKRKDVWAVERKIRAAISPFAKAACISLCEDIYTTLPREIRDMIYDYTHAHDTIFVGPEYFEKTTPPCESDRKAHYWDAEYVGSEMRIEIVESWYRSSLFYFYDKTNNAQVIKQFLATDRWGLGIKPRSLICHARIELSVDTVIHHRVLRNYREEPCCTMRNAGQGFIKPLKNFDCLPNNVEFMIRVQTYDAPHTGCLPMAELRDAIKVMVEQLGVLHKAGHRIVLQWPDLDGVELSWKKTRFSTPEWIEQLELAAHLTPSGSE